MKLYVYKKFLKIITLPLIFCLVQNIVVAEEIVMDKIKLNSLLQFWYQYDDSETPKDTFRIRRAEIKLSGEIKPDVVYWTLMLDPAAVREDDTKFTTVDNTKVVKETGRKSLLQDFVITLKPYRFLFIDFGQYKIPFGMEGLESSAKLDFVERSAIATQFKWSDYRDIGFTLKGDFKINNVKIQSAVGFFNGEGQNKLDINEPMDFVCRLVVKPSEMLHLGVAHYNGKTGKNEKDKVYTGVELKFVKDPITIYGEYASGKSGDTEKLTYYLTLGYKIYKFIQVVARYDSYDFDITTVGGEKYELTAGVNYFIKNDNAKIQLNYVYCGETGTQVGNNIIRLNVQVSY